MAQIFISHSSRDIQGVDFFSKVFSGTKVRAVFEENEKLTGISIDTMQIRKDIGKSDALFILLDEHIEHFNHTRDWVAWECGYALQNKKDIWIFERQEDFSKITMVIPALNHNVLYNPTGDWFSYIRGIVNSYDNGDVLTKALLTANIGGALAKRKDRTTGYIVGGLTALAFSNNNPTPPGARIRCPHCYSIYSVHVPPNLEFRCPVCNWILQLDSWGYL